MSLHLYTAASQPLTRYRYDGDRRWHGLAPGDTTRVCWTCGRRRAARNLVIQCYYDGIRIFCREGHDRDRWGRYVTRKEKR